MRILVLRLMMSFLSHSAFGAAEGGGAFEAAEGGSAVVIGGGPAGYAAAFALLKKRMKVTLIEKRSENTRSQIFFMSKNLIYGFLDLTELRDIALRVLEGDDNIDFNEIMKALIDKEKTDSKTSFHTNMSTSKSMDTTLSAHIKAKVAV